MLDEKAPPAILIWSARAAAWPLYLKFASATFVVTGVLLIRLALDPYLVTYRALFFLPAVVLVSALLGRISGVYAALLSTLFVFYFLTEPKFSFAIADERAGLGLALFLTICVSLALFISSLHATILRSWTEARNAELKFAELQHRMRNNLQIAAALLITQSRNSSTETRDALRVAAERIGSLAAIQDRTSRAQRDETVDSRAFIQGLCSDIAGSLIGIRPIEMDVSSVSTPLPTGDAAPLGLIINELVTNAMKYAFPDERNGKIVVRLDKVENNFELTVADNGIGIEAGVRSAAGGLGSILIRAMAGQIGGSVLPRLNGAGTSWVVRFPAREPG